ncbi:AraC family transcriptional regulator [Nocardia macrotermitis]|uniref:IS5 family transposase IS4811 n=1 Tax=Nocardia macrotermitis TaxID=2585198 RepID=A0A7K0DCF7_9NOCA|nr:AraC family transcriptional regulator [Nocardia macrotermitis]MQY23466.1 IS5 family transposase IS4811 [Nocardia macrotermitis]
MDLLADVLTVTGVRGSLGVRIEAADSWKVSWPDSGPAVFYAVIAGTAWLRLPGGEPVRLMPGDVVLLPTGSEHTLGDGSEALARPCDSVRAEHARAEASVLRLGEGEVRTHILGACYEYDPVVSTQVLTSLPELVHIRADNGGSCLDDTVRLLARELATPQLATAVVLNRLIDVLLIQLIRVWLDRKPVQQNGSWLAVLSDPLVGVAMTKLHQNPARPWTTDLLAAELAVSRTTLARRFRTVAGETPGSYLTRWRMNLAALRLRDTDDTLETIARTVGYTSLPAFSRAFRRDRGQAPGAYRHTIRARSTAR